jgi:hypothetical protein
LPVPADTAHVLSFRRLDVYQRVPLAGLRSSSAGRWSESDAANRDKVACGEAMECAASLNVMRLRELINDARYARGIKLIEGVVAMLTKMI